MDNNFINNIIGEDLYKKLEKIYNSEYKENFIDAFSYSAQNTLVETLYLHLSHTEKFNYFLNEYELSILLYYPEALNLISPDEDNDITIEDCENFKNAVLKFKNFINE